MSWNPFRAGSMSAPLNIAAWVAAGGLALWWQSRETVDGNKAVFSSLDAAQWNAKRKAALAAAAASGGGEDAPRGGAGR